MLFSATRQINFVMITVSGFFCLTVLTAFVCIFMTAPSDRAVYHYKQAQFLELSYEALSHSDYTKPNLLSLSERELLQSVYLDPYNALVWKNLADVAQKNQRMGMANQALRFSHQFSDYRVIKDLPSTMTIASNEVTYRYK